MKVWLGYFARVVTVTGLLLGASIAVAQTCKLDIKKVDAAKPPASRTEFLFRSTTPQSFFMQLGGPAGMVRGAGDQEKPKFSEIIKKEPAKYEAEQPFRGVAKLGDDYYGFVFDTAPPEKEEKKEDAGKDGNDKEGSEKKGYSRVLQPGAARLGAQPAGPPPVCYSRLYFDVNRNGDLSDDPVVEATSARPGRNGTAYSSFPRVDLTISVGGEKMDYAFTMAVNSRSSGNISYASGSLNAAAYRDGEMTLGGKKYRVAVVDFNSNGVFNDAFAVDPSGPVTATSLWRLSSRCDRWFAIEPEAASTGSISPVVAMSNTLNNVAGLVRFEDGFYDLKITPSGDTLTLAPSSVPLGYVTNPNKGYSAVVYGKEGVLKITGDESGKASLPEGEWRLMSYSIDRTPPEPEKSEAKDGETTGDKPAATRVVRRTQSSVASGRAQSDYKPVKVTEGTTVEMPFGPPYCPTVSARAANSAKRQVSLGLTLVGAGGDICSSLRVDGRRPDKPKFTITTGDGEEVQSGAFEYG